MNQIGAKAVLKLATELRRKDGNRHALDTYLTSAAIAVRMVHLSFTNWRKAGGQYSASSPVRVADLGAGVGIFGIAARLYFEKMGVPCQILGVDLNPAYRKTMYHDSWHVMDVTALTIDDFGRFDIINMNPPFEVEMLLTFIKVARSLLTPAGQVGLLAPARFEFHRLDFFKKGHYFKRRIVLDRRPSFYQLLLDGNPHVEPIPTRKSKKTGKWLKPSRRQTDVHECCVYLFDKNDRYPDPDDFWQWEFFPEEHDDYDEYFPGEGDIVSKSHNAAQQDLNMVVYAMFYEASRRQDGSMIFDDLYSLLTARQMGWGFYRISDAARQEARRKLKIQLLAEQAKRGLANRG